MPTLRWLVFLALVLTITGCDHATKLMASTDLPDGHSVSLISGLLSLERAHNADTAFSLLSGIIPTAPRLLLLKTSATLGTLLIAALTIIRFGRASTIERLAFACLLGGAVGNALDRWRWGYVVDFIHIEYWPTFNVADLSLSVGAGLLLISSWHTSRANSVVARTKKQVPGREPE